MTAPWLAPDGREWGVRRRTRAPRVRRTSAFYADIRLLPARRTPVYRACRLSIDLIGAGPLGSPALWALYR